MEENSREEDIKNLNEIIELSKEEIDAKDENITAILDIEDLISLEHILSEYKRVLKENEELKVELERQKDINTIINQKRIDKNYEKALEKSMLKFLKTNMAKDFVSVQKVKDKIRKNYRY